MKFLKTIFLCVTCVISGASFAAQSSNISLGGGAVGSRQVFTLPLNKFMPNASYQVVCKITDNNNQNNKVICLLLL